jgi:hypothetical protein
MNVYFARPESEALATVMDDGTHKRDSAMEMDKIIADEEFLQDAVDEFGKKENVDSNEDEVHIRFADVGSMKEEASHISLAIQPELEDNPKEEAKDE